MGEPFILFGPAHLGALLLTIALAVGLSWPLHHRGSAQLETAVRLGLAVFLIAMTTAHVLWCLDHRPVTVWEFLPLHLCDLCIFVSLYALLTKHKLAAELLYFWTCSGTLLAMVLPACEYGFPNQRFFIYFSLHGGIVVTSVVLVYGLGLRPDRRAPLRAFGFTLLYTLIIAIVDFASGQNYLFLAHKPAQETLLDYFGPWPLYIFVALAIGLGLFYLLALPFMRSETSGPAQRGRPAVSPPP
jgi:hypothetical integral membrane protein (TIGR02206 family)